MIMTDNSSHKEIFSAIKSDDTELFSKHMQEKRTNISLCFGRFPLLSLCYLYKSVKIVKEYENELNNVLSYNFTDEIPEMYEKFRPLAKRCLRLYTDGRIVSPAEMLALTEDSLYLKSVYPTLRKPGDAQENIEKIYRLNHKQSVTQREDKIIIRRIPLSLVQKLCIVLCIVLAACMIASPILIWDSIKTSFGIGTDEYPITVSNESQLRLALSEKVNYFVLSDNITVSEPLSIEKFSGTLNGNGHTLSFTQSASEGFIKELTGTIENINLSFTGIKKETSENMSFLTQKNSGNIRNVSLYIDAEITEKTPLAEGQKEEDSVTLLFACFALENSGELYQCTLGGNISLFGDSVGDAYFGGFAALNTGRIINCSTLPDAKITADTVDICAIAAENGTNGTINTCENKAAISQTTASSSWNPNVAGLALINSGKILKSSNSGKISSVSTAENASTAVYAAGLVAIGQGKSTVENSENSGEIIATAASSSVYAGGLSAINEGTVEHSKNSGSITAASASSIIYAGGICAYGYEASVVSNSCAYGNISAATTATESIFIFAGGIMGYDCGTVKNSYSAAKLSSKNTEAYLGGIVGGILGYLYFGQFSLHGAIENNFYVKDGGTALAFAVILVPNGTTLYPYPDSGQNHGGTAVTLDELKAKEIYWG